MWCVHVFNGFPFRENLRQHWKYTSWLQEWGKRLLYINSNLDLVVPWELYVENLYTLRTKLSLFSDNVQNTRMCTFIYALLWIDLFGCWLSRNCFPISFNRRFQKRSGVCQRHSIFCNEQCQSNREVGGDSWFLGLVTSVTSDIIQKNTGWKGKLEISISHWNTRSKRGTGYWNG